LKKKTLGSVTFQESRNSTEKLVNVTVSVTYWQEVQVDVLKNSTIYQRFQVCKQVAVLVFPVGISSKQKNTTVYFRSLQRSLTTWPLTCMCCPAGETKCLVTCHSCQCTQAASCVAETVWAWGMNN